MSAMASCSASGSAVNRRRSEGGAGRHEPAAARILSKSASEAALLASSVPLRVKSATCDTGGRGQGRARGGGGRLRAQEHTNRPKNKQQARHTWSRSKAYGQNLPSALTFLTGSDMCCSINAK